ncbi:MAG: hypothetical protein KC418_08905 [Anaerolineales bacterium]|nr:hypothetical protein [Anaerolineales bacterium]
MQRLQGNAAVQRRIAARQAAPTVQRTSVEEYDARATQFHDLLQTSTSDKHRALNLLLQQDEGDIYVLTHRYDHLYGENLQDVVYGLHKRVDLDLLLKAVAHLRFGHAHGYETAMALALIPAGTRDVQVFAILQALPLSGRQKMEERYNQAFADFGQGSLQADLYDDFMGNALQRGNEDWYKALALLHRAKLTPAEELYLLTSGRDGTAESAAIKLIQDEWLKGAENFEKLKADWKAYVNNETAWTTHSWFNRNQGLYTAMEEEFSGEDWQLIRAVLSGASQYEYQFGDTESARNMRELAGYFGEEHQEITDEEARLITIENMQIDVAQDSLLAAIRGAGTNDEQVFKWLAELQKIWAGRIKRHEGTKTAEAYERIWESNKQSYLNLIGTDMDTWTEEYKHARLIVKGDLNAADELYLALYEEKYDEAADLVIKFWADKKVESLFREAGIPTTDAGVIVRPSYSILGRMIGEIGAKRERMVYPLLNYDYDEATRGAIVIERLLARGVFEGALAEVHAFLNHDALSEKAALRDDVVAAYARRNLQAVQPPWAENEPTAKFLLHIFHAGEVSYSSYEILNLLAPATTAEEMLKRAQYQLAATQTGVLNALLEAGVAVYSEMSAEDVSDVATESLQRLASIVKEEGISKDELEVMMAMFEVEDVTALAQVEMAQFQKALARLRGMKQTAANVISTALEALAALVLAPFTGGSSVAAVAAAVTPAIIGMLTREALLGSDYELASAENAGKIAQALVGFGVGKVAGRALQAFDPLEMKMVGLIKSPFWEEVASGAISSAASDLATGYVTGEFPDLKDQGAKMIGLIFGAGGAVVKGEMKAELSDQTSDALRLWINVSASTGEYVTSNLPDVVQTLAGKDDLTTEQMVLELAKFGAKAVTNGARSGIAGYASDKAKMKLTKEEMKRLREMYEAYYEEKQKWDEAEAVWGGKALIPVEMQRRQAEFVAEWQMILAELEVDRIVDEIVIEDEDGTAEVLDRLDEYAEQREKAEAAQ